SIYKNEKPNRYGINGAIWAILRWAFFSTGSQKIINTNAVMPARINSHQNQKKMSATLQFKKSTPYIEYKFETKTGRNTRCLNLLNIIFSMAHSPAHSSGRRPTG